MKRCGDRIATYLGIRLLLIAPTTVAASLLMFAVLRLLPGDVALTILSGSTHTEEMREALRAELGLDDPWYTQYLRWLAGMVDGSGLSLETGESARSIVLSQLPVTLLLAGYATTMSLVVAFPLGVVAAVHRGRSLDTLIRGFFLAGFSVPAVWAALLVLLGLIRLFRWSPPIVYSTPFEDLRAHVQIMVWPALLLAWEYGAHIVRVTRASVSETLKKEFVVAARARGLIECGVIVRYALRNSLLPPMTVIGLQFGTLLGGSLVVETVFGLPGIGRGIVHAATARDLPLLLTQAVALVIAYQFLNFAIDTLYLVADPRVELRPESNR